MHHVIYQAFSDRIDLNLIEEAFGILGRGPHFSIYRIAKILYFDQKALQRIKKHVNGNSPFFSNASVLSEAIKLYYVQRNGIAGRDERRAKSQRRRLRLGRCVMAAKPCPKCRQKSSVVHHPKLHVEEAQCPVCLENVTHGVSVFKTCGHIVCTSCWFRL